MLRRWSRLQRSQVHTGLPFSMPRVQVSRAWASSADPEGTRPQVTHTMPGSSAAYPASLSDNGTQPLAAFAAALARFLKSRTFCSDSGPTTSATERKEPGSA